MSRNPSKHRNKTNAYYKKANMNNGHTPRFNPNQAHLLGASSGQQEFGYQHIPFPNAQASFITAQTTKGFSVTQVGGFTKLEETALRIFASMIQKDTYDHIPSSVERFPERSEYGDQYEEEYKRHVERVTKDGQFAADIYTNVARAACLAAGVFLDTARQIQENQAKQQEDQS